MKGALVGDMLVPWKALSSLLIIVMIKSYYDHIATRMFFLPGFWQESGSLHVRESYTYGMMHCL